MGSFVSGLFSGPATATPTLSPTSPPPTATSTSQPSPSPTAAPTEAAANPAATVQSTPAEVPTYSYQVLKTYPHDPKAFTQGLVFEDGIFYEGTGLKGQSSLRRVAVESGEVLQQIDLAAEYFGEGITVLGDKIYQLTWQSNIGFVYDKESFELLQEFSYPTEGWGLTHDGRQLIMSDGTANLYFLDPDTLERTHQVEVRYQGNPLAQLNELEYINGEVYANVWRTTNLVRIDPTSGQVVGLIDLTGLLNPADVSEPVDVLNGIAYDPDGDRLFVTGKWWPNLFEIALTPGN
jgi:glutamine cyclotransferase